MMDYNPVPPILITLFLVVAIGLIMAGRGGQLSATRLIMLGVFLAVGAVLYEALLPMIGMNRTGGMPNMIVATGQATGQATGGLLKIGFLLVLAGVVGFLGNSGGPRPVPSDREAPHVS